MQDGRERARAEGKTCAGGGERVCASTDSSACGRGIIGMARASMGSKARAGDNMHL